MRGLTVVIFQSIAVSFAGLVWVCVQDNTKSLDLSHTKSHNLSTKYLNSTIFGVLHFFWSPTMKSSCWKSSVIATRRMWDLSNEVLTQPLLHGDKDLPNEEGNRNVS